MSASTGVLLPFEKQAMDGDPIPDGLIASDKVMYIALRGLYRQVKLGVISREVAVSEKNRLLQDYKELQWMDDQWRRYVKTIKDTEAARSEYRKNRTIENADKLLIAFDGIA